MPFRPYEEGIEVNGRTVYAVVDGADIFKKSAACIMADCGIGEQHRDGSVTIDPDGWYPQSAWLAAFERIAALGGRMAARGAPSLLYRIGLAIPRNAEFPEGIDDLPSAIRSIDVAYHMNHRKNGEIMYSPREQAFVDGIGHYGCEPCADRQEIVCRCENPYPCEFDRGILTAMARRFVSHATVAHEPAIPCRNRGDDNCRYVIRW